MRITDYNCKFFSSKQGLSTFLSEARKYKVLGTSEEEKLIYDYKNGNEEAGNTLVKHNLLFIYSLAKIYARDEEEVLDYVNEGVLGFKTALNEFKPDKGYKIITYAVWYIRRSMNFYLIDTRNMITRSNSNKIGKKVDAIKQRHYAEFGREPSIEEIKALLKKHYDIDIKDNSDVYDVYISSINEEIDDEYTAEESTEYNERTSSINEYEEAMETEYKKARIISILSYLPDKMADIIKMLYGVGEYDRKYSAQEVAEKYGIRAIEVAAKRDKAIKYLQQNKKLFKEAL